MIPQAEKPKPDMMEQVGRMLGELADNRFAVPKLAHAADVADTPNERTDALRADTVVVLASAVLAVAAGLRDIHNVLHEINQNSAPPPPAPHYPDQRQHESLQAQITRLNEWLEEYAPAQYAAPGDTADAVLAVLAQEGDEICGLREQLAQMDVDNAALTAQLAQANTDAEKLVLAIAAIQGLQSENAALPAKEGRS